MNNKIYPCDYELEKQTGDKYFISYAEDTKLKTFRTLKEAKEFKKSLEYTKKYKIIKYKKVGCVFEAEGEEEAIKQIGGYSLKYPSDLFRIEVVEE